MSVPFSVEKTESILGRKEYIYHNKAIPYVPGKILEIFDRRLIDELTLLIRCFYENIGYF